MRRRPRPRANASARASRREPSPWPRADAGEVHLAQLAHLGVDRAHAAASGEPPVACDHRVEGAAAREVARLEVGQIGVDAGRVRREPVLAQHRLDERADGGLVGARRGSDRVAPEAGGPSRGQRAFAREPRHELRRASARSSARALTAAVYTVCRSKPAAAPPRASRPAWRGSRWPACSRWRCPLASASSRMAVAPLGKRAQRARTASPMPELSRAPCAKWIPAVAFRGSGK